MADPTLVYSHSSSMEVGVNVTPVRLRVPRPGAGNAVVLFIHQNTSQGDPTVFDDSPPGSSGAGNIWKRLNGVVNNSRISVWGTTNASPKTKKIYISWSGALAAVQYEYSEWRNVSLDDISNVLDGSATGANVSGNTVSTGSLTTAQNGSVVLHYGVVNGGTGTLTSFTNGSGFISIRKQADVNVSEAPTYLQYKIQTTAGSLTPTFTIAGKTSPVSDTVAIALKAQSGAGSAKSSSVPASTNIIVAGVQQRDQQNINSITSMALMFPHVGNLIHANIVHDDATNGVISSFTDGDGHTWGGGSGLTTTGGNHVLQSGLTHDDAWRAQNLTPNTEMSGPTIVWTGTAGAGAVAFVTLYDIVGAHATPWVQEVTGDNTQTDGIDNLSTVTITPSQQNGLIICDLIVESHTVVELISPSDDAGGVTAMGTAPQQDGGGTTMEDDDGRAYYYNGNSLDPVTFIWRIQNNTNGVNRWGAVATEYKAADLVGLSLTRFRFRNDDGSLTAATNIGSLNSQPTLSAGTTYRVRARIENTSGSSAGTGYKWQSSFDGNIWVDITTSSAFVKAVSSANFSDGADTTELQSGSGSAGTYVTDNNAATQTGAFTLTATLATGTSLESELAFQLIPSDVAGHQQVQFRIVKSGGTVFDNYVAYPVALLNQAPGTLGAFTNPKLPILKAA